jgi:hypothetical protein
MQEVSIHDGRRELPSSSLDVEGFRLVSQESAVSDFYDDEQINTTYHAEVKSLLTDVLGAARIEIFDDTRRSTSLERQKELKIREAADIVHNDYTARSGIKRLRDHFSPDPDTAGKLLEGRFAIVNVWRSIAGPILNHHLTLCDASSVNAGDLVPVERRADERIGEIQVALFDSGQRWYYFPEMQMDEALLFKTFDSETDGRTLLRRSFGTCGCATPREYRDPLPGFFLIGGSPGHQKSVARTPKLHSAMVMAIYQAAARS